MQYIVTACFNNFNKVTCYTPLTSVRIN